MATPPMRSPRSARMLTLHGRTCRHLVAGYAGARAALAGSSDLAQASGKAAGRAYSTRPLGPVKGCAAQRTDGVPAASEHRGAPAGPRLSRPDAPGTGL